MELLLGIGTGGIQGGQPIPVQFAAGLLAVWALLFFKKLKAYPKS